MWYRAVVIASAMLVLAITRAPAEELNVGDSAPKLAVKEFIKGDPVTSFDNSKIYVVEFWATWCGPCRVSIPHLTGLQKKHKDVTFIGVSVYESDQNAVKPFVEKMGDQMDYRVAIDAVPEGAKRGDGKMAKTWMDAASQDGIPTAFIINGEGKVAWVGHPMKMEKPLEQIINGSWDLQAAAKQSKQELAQKRKLKEIFAKLEKARQSGDTQAELAVLDEALAQDPQLEQRLGFQKFTILAGQTDAEAKALEYGQQLVETVFNKNAQALNALAWTLVDPKGKKHDAKFIKLALKAAQRADELTNSKDPAISDTLAKAYFDDGDAAKAYEIQERAVKLAEGTPLEKDQSLKERLEQYRAAAKK